MRHATAPAVAATARALDRPADDVAAAYRRLAAARVIVLAQDTLDIRFAAPFAVVPTAHSVTVGATTYYAPCAWDAMGVPAALDADAVIRSTCPDCDEPLTVTVTDRAVGGDAEIAHFNVPACRWWDDIGFT